MSRRSRYEEPHVDPSSPLPDGCFVATACYGVDDTITDDLRVWRDKQTNWFTVGFIHLYYDAGLGKIGAKMLNIFTFLKPLSRVTIKIFMKMFRIQHPSKEF